MLILPLIITLTFKYPVWLYFTILFLLLSFYSLEHISDINLTRYRCEYIYIIPHYFWLYLRCCIRYKMRLIVVPISWPLESARVPGSCSSVILKVAFIAGSSKQGNAFRASVGCICVVATTLKNKIKIKKALIITSKYKKIPNTQKA